MGSKMARKGKLKRWFVSMLSGVIVATTVMGTSVVAFAEEGDNQPQIEENQNDQGNDNAPENENQEQETGEPEVQEVIVESGEGLVITKEPDSSQTVKYDKEVAGMLTEESAHTVVDEKTTEQESIKANIEGQGGSYDYSVNVDGPKDVEIPKEITDLSKDEAEKKAGELKQTEGVVTDSVSVKESGNEKAVSDSKTFETEKDAQDYVDELKNADNVKKDSVTYTITPVTTTAEKTYDEGYYISLDGVDRSDPYTPKGVYTIHITGGVDKIEINFDEIREIQPILPSYCTYAVFKVVNETDDDYVITKDGYSELVDGIARWTYDFNEDYGKLQYTYEDNKGETRYVFKPNMATEVDGKDVINDYGKYTLLTNAISYFRPEFDEEGNIISGEPDPLPNTVEALALRKDWIDGFYKTHKKLTEKEVVAFYNWATGEKHETTAEAWEDYFKKYGWTFAFKKTDETGEPQTSGYDFFIEGIRINGNTESDKIELMAKMDGPYVDNSYENTIIDTVLIRLTLQALQKFNVKADYIEKLYNVTYKELVNAYVVTVSGSGYIPGGGGDDPDPIPDPTPDPTPVITTPGDSPAVLGAQRELPGEAPAVLGARRAGTSDETNMVLRLIVIAASVSVLVIARKRAHN